MHSLYITTEGICNIGDIKLLTDRFVNLSLLTSMLEKIKDSEASSHMTLWSLNKLSCLSHELKTTICNVFPQIQPGS